jgi:hypothetical protein
MGKKWLARKTRLRLVLLGGEIVGPAEKFQVIAGTIATYFIHQFDKA